MYYKRRQRTINNNSFKTLLINKIVTIIKTHRLTRNKQNSKKKWTKEQFISHIDSVLTNKNFKIENLKDTEIRNLGKLLCTNPEMITKMDKKEHRKLSILYHPDKNPNDKNAEICFKLVQILYENSPSKDC